MPLQPTDIPSRAGIQAAIDEVYDRLTARTPWVNLTQTGGTAVTGTVQYRIVGEQYVQLRPAFTLAANLSVPPHGDISNISFEALPAEARPGSDVLWSTKFANGTTVMAWMRIYAGGSVQLDNVATRTDQAGGFTILAGATLVGMTGLIPIGV